MRAGENFGDLCKILIRKKELKIGNKDKFRDYLIKEGYAENTARDYVTAINVISGILGIDLWSINDIKGINNIEKILSTNSAYNKKNTKGKEMYSNALERYKEFL